MRRRTVAVLDHLDDILGLPAGTLARALDPAHPGQKRCPDALDAASGGLWQAADPDLAVAADGSARYTCSTQHRRTTRTRPGSIREIHRFGLRRCGVPVARADVLLEVATDDSGQQLTALFCGTGRPLLLEPLRRVLFPLDDVLARLALRPVVLPTTATTALLARRAVRRVDRWVESVAPLLADDATAVRMRHRCVGGPWPPTAFPSRLLPVVDQLAELVAEVDRARAHPTPLGALASDWDGTLPELFDCAARLQRPAVS